MKKITMTNAEIYTIATVLSTMFEEGQHIPARLNFLIQKNYKVLYSYIALIEGSRDILLTQYNIDDKNEREKANNEFADMMLLSQEFEITPIPLSWFDGLSFTSKQMEALFFMIEED